MIATDRLAEFLLIALVVIAVPGPSVLFIVSRGVALGRRAALATVAGNAAGLFAQVVAVALGVGALVQASESVFTAVKIAGAAYLVFLGVQAILTRGALADAVAGGVAPSGGRHVAMQGFIVGVTNPKGFVLLSAILPQFVDPALGHVPLQMLILGAMCCAIALVSDGVWGLLAGTARDWLARSPRNLRIVGAGAGAVMIGLGIRLLTLGRPD
jgi:threonine/homoserine/homoserine lactone efflux protein